MAYGRCSFVRAHFNQSAEKIIGREFMLDEAHRLVVNWQVFAGNQLAYVIHGVLDWNAES